MTDAFSLTTLLSTGGAWLSSIAPAAGAVVAVFLAFWALSAVVGLFRNSGGGNPAPGERKNNGAER